MLDDRSFEYFPKLKFIKIEGLPPQGWDDLTTVKQFEEIKKITSIKLDINYVQFDY